MKTCELVIARFDEDLSWLRRVPKSFRVAVYDKGDVADPTNPLPNVGREAHTYLHHIANRYDSLADVTVFCQGKPFDHVPDLHRTLRRIVQDELQIEGFLWLGFIVDQDDLHGTLFQQWAGDAEKRGLLMAEFWQELFGEISPLEFVFFPSAHFVVTRGQVHRRPLDFYHRARELSTSLPDAAHCFERCWDHVFGVDGVPAAYRRATHPIYLKPIKRLGIDGFVLPHAGARPAW